MLGKLNKKDLAVRAKKMKVATQTLPTEDLKLKVVFDVAPAPTDDEETYSRPVFKRRRKATTEPSELFISDGRAPSQQAPPPSPPPPRDMVVVQEGEGTSTQEEELWDPKLDVLPSWRKSFCLPKPRKTWLASRNITLCSRLRGSWGRL